MPDPIFAHPHLAQIYDEFEGARTDLTAYAAVADELNAQTVIDIGCGTGSFAVRLASTGRAVTAVDPASASLEIARAKKAPPGICWLQGDATTLPEVGADLAVMTGNVAQVFVTDDEWADTLNSIARSLSGGGHFVFETRRPGRRAWEEWADSEPVVRDIPGIGRVERSLDVTAVELPLVSFRHTYTFAADGTVLVSDSTLRFREQAEVEADLAAHGYRIRDVREAPDRPGRELVFIAEKP
ncbi:class I SAM-dependent methyltransferase [Nocardia mexicana]|uniref:Methyltransferase family protein n=1 Tax=Nocardia mexicana TaxID=279262 RepID=A0A370H4U2_9NOCA|nr:class I SAM-dependent methyltransferase [Nocardia mexicana]RDI51057.1 methyltransferase family protein [Nocardia mexicana]